MSASQDSPVCEELPARQPPELPPRFQFGISTLLWITTGTAVICALLFPMPGIIAIPVLLFVIVVIMPAVWTTMIVYGRDYQRTFAIGALFPAAIILSFFGLNGLRGLPLSFATTAGEDIAFRLVLFAFWLSSFLVGAICVGVRRFLERRDSHATANADFTTRPARQSGE